MHDAEMRMFMALHETFGQNQAARHERYATVLNAARMAFRNDKAVTAELDSFKKPKGRSRKEKPDTGTE